MALANIECYSSFFYCCMYRWAQGRRWKDSAAIPWGQQWWTTQMYE